MTTHFFGDTTVLLGRSLRHITRSLDTIITDTIMPIALIPGLSAKTVDGASAFAYPIIFLPFISSAFVLADTMRGPVRAFADNQPVTSIVNTVHDLFTQQPVTSIVNTVRDLFTQQPVSTGIWIALAWCLGILIVAYALAMATYHRKIV